MHTYSCFLFEDNVDTPMLSFIVAASLDRARELARRELLRERGVALEICEGGRLLWAETLQPA
jgi:hypothetical protein